MNPEVCQSDSSIWNNKHTKCTDYIELLNTKYYEDVSLILHLKNSSTKANEVCIYVSS